MSDAAASLAHTSIFSSAASASTPKRSAIERMRSGRKVPMCQGRLQAILHTFGINVCNFAFGTSHIHWKLRCDTESMRELSLAASKFAIDLGR